ncbi:hypothetical protein CYMTET_22427 [Cymbomonas tetramitiformis]|uniref:Uncharacterized protein n=1 Tax=Cymbomonas tetramitiformis TaxID=36881 RepID=A0AAE0G086_9CHLO|nr:hypothetical protein CYMTET_22427 [Cymbomonas tetramitiformis]
MPAATGSKRLRRHGAITGQAMSNSFKNLRVLIEKSTSWQRARKCEMRGADGSTATHFSNLGISLLRLHVSIPLDYLEEKASAVMGANACSTTATSNNRGVAQDQMQGGEQMGPLDAPGAWEEAETAHPPREQRHRDSVLQAGIRQAYRRRSIFSQALGQAEFSAAGLDLGTAGAADGEPEGSVTGARPTLSKVREGSNGDIAVALTPATGPEAVSENTKGDEEARWAEGCSALAEEVQHGQLGEPADEVKVICLGSNELLLGTGGISMIQVPSGEGGGGPWATGEQSSDQLRRRQVELPVERMIGTALVQAFFGIKSLLSCEDLRRQAELAEQLPWQMPGSQPFSWYVKVLKVLIGSIQRDGWYQRSRLWNCVFLQREDGSFELSQCLATVLHAGEPADDLALNPLARYSLRALQDSVPRALLLLASDCTPEWKASELWGTILVLKMLQSCPYTWTENPEDPPKKQITICARSHSYLSYHEDRTVGLGVLLPALLGEAETLCEQWQADHEHRVQQVYEKHTPQQGEPGSSGRTSFHSHRTWWQKLDRRRCWLKLKRHVKWLAKAHPLTAIYLVHATEPFTRSERILIQTQTFLLMLMFTVWFYYSKAKTCCVATRAHLACPEAGKYREPCLGAGYCMELHQMAASNLLPAELNYDDFICTAFPQSTYLGKIQAMVIIVGILTPVTMIMSQLFIMASNSAVPGHWGTFPLKSLGKCFGSTPTAVMQTVFITAYALFFNFQKFNKAVAVTIVALIGFILKPHMVQTAIRAITSTIYWGYNKAGQVLWGALVARFSEEERSLLESINLVSPFEKYLQKVGYFLMLCIWTAIVVSLLTYATVIREMMGPEEEINLVWTWFMVLVTETFGKEAIKLILIRLFVNTVMEKLERVFLDINPAMRWFESFIMHLAKTARARETDEVGDQDMGDDAEADGGGDMEGNVDFNSENVIDSGMM